MMDDGMPNQSLEPTPRSRRGCNRGRQTRRGSALSLAEGNRMFSIVTSVIALLVLLTGLGLGFCIPADMKSAYNATSSLWGSFVLLWISAFGAFSSRELLKSNAEWIGSKNTLVARVACVIGMLLAIGFAAMAILSLLHKL